MRAASTIHGPAHDQPHAIAVPLHQQAMAIVPNLRGASRGRPARPSHRWEAVGDTAKARDLCEREDMTIVQDIGDMPPEAEGGEVAATLYLRVPPTLKARVEARRAASPIHG